MTAKSNNVIVIASLGDWQKNVAPVFQPMRSKTKTNCTMYMFSNTLSMLQVFTRNSDWFIVRFAPVVFGGSNCFGLSFSTAI